ncbi:MAG: cell surface protein SprA, partial [Candidatus Symbiothrix sp.]|nr:cell surface protein SprA [Candidatus Symbiothrix sp.]
VDIDRNELVVGKNHITDKITKQVYLANGNTEQVDWYQFRIPLHDKSTRQDRGNIRNFKSIRFMRIYLTDFEEDIHLRFASMDLVRGEWRTYTKNLQTGGASSATIDVQAVNIEENSDKRPVNYILPPGVSRQNDPGQPQLLQQNEQSMLLKVKNLFPGEAKAVYKKTSYDMRQYKRLQMFVHAEQLPDDNANLRDYELSCFIRLGSDMTNNYYEYEIPLKLTPEGNYSQANNAHLYIVWPRENMFDFPFTALTQAKLKRNRDSQNGLGIPYETYDPQKPANNITVVGNPSISNVENIMIGIRNKNGTTVKSGEIWVNELRMSEFDESGGWAAMANIALGLSDIGTVNFAGRTETAGFGSIESNVTNRRMEDMYQMNFSTALDLGRFLPEKAKIQLPAYYSYTNETLSPKYNPLDEDILLDDALNNAVTRQERDSIKNVSQTVATSKSFNISGARVNIKSKKPQFYDPANVTVSYSHSETNEHSADIESNLIKDQKAAINYSYSFNAKPWEPFKDSKAMSNPAFKLIKELNLYYLPASLSFNTNMQRQFAQVRLRSFDMQDASLSDPMNQPFSNDFMWNRQFDFKYNLTRGISLSLSTTMNANIDEGELMPEISKEYYELWRDTVWSSIRKLGRPYAYQQVFNASWNVPVNKLPMMDWVSSSRLSYNSNYRWDRGAEIEGGTKIGNIANSRGDWQADAAFSFETLYNKSKYLQGVNRRYGAQPANKRPFQPKTYTQTLNLEKGKAASVNHRLGSETLSVSAKSKSGSTVGVSYKTSNATSLEITANTDMDSVTVTVVTKDPNERTPVQKVVDFSARTLMMLRSASINYRQSNSLTLPGFKSEPGFFGQQTVNGVYAPGYAFAFGIHDENTVGEALEKDWLYTGEDLITPAVTAYTSNLEIRVGLEPLPGLKIDLDAKRYEAKNTSMLLMADMPTTFNGSYNISTVAIATAFKPLGDVNNNYASEMFDAFLTNRTVIANRLNEQRANTRYPVNGFFQDNNLGNEVFDPDKGKYERNSPDVLIPAFLAAYTGRNANTINANPFLSIWSILPNWKASYDGLSRLAFVKEHFRSVRVTHAYVSSYSIGSYTSFSTWVPMPGEDDTALGYIRDVQNNNPVPSSAYDIASVSLIENFSPLIGVNATLKNSLTPKVEYRKQRNMALNLASLQLIETKSDEFVVGIGYVLKEFDVILRLKNDKQSKIKNDLTINADVSYKDIKSLLRKIDENVTQPSSGNKLFTIKIMADYVFSSKMNIRLFYDYQANTPLISTSYPVSASNFGMSFKLMLTR